MADYSKPLPRITRLNRPLFEGTKQGELRLQRCVPCGHHWFPPSSHCPRCLSPEYEWAAVSGRGRLWSWIVMHQRYFPSFEADLPYVVAFVQLDEGPFLMSTVVDIPDEGLRCDLPVHVVFEDATDEIAIPKFRPTE